MRQGNWAEGIIAGFNMFSKMMGLARQGQQLQMQREQLDLQSARQRAYDEYRKKQADLAASREQRMQQQHDLEMLQAEYPPSEYGIHMRDGFTSVFKLPEPDIESQIAETQKLVKDTGGRATMTIPGEGVTTSLTLSPEKTETDKGIKYFKSPEEALKEGRKELKELNYTDAQIDRGLKLSGTPTSGYSWDWSGIDRVPDYREYTRTFTRGIENINDQMDSAAVKDIIPYQTRINNINYDWYAGTRMQERTMAEKAIKEFYDENKNNPNKIHEFVLDALMLPRWEKDYLQLYAKRMQATDDPAKQNEVFREIEWMMNPNIQVGITDDGTLTPNPQQAKHSIPLREVLAMRFYRDPEARATNEWISQELEKLKQNSFNINITQE